MKDVDTIQGADLVRLGQHRTAVENELMIDTMEWCLAWCVGACVVLLLVWLS